MWQTAANEEKAARLATFCARRRWVAGGTTEEPRYSPHVGRVTYCGCGTCGWNLVLYGWLMNVCVTGLSMPLTEARLLPSRKLPQDCGRFRRVFGCVERQMTHIAFADGGSRKPAHIDTRFGQGLGNSCLQSRPVHPLEPERVKARSLLEPGRFGGLDLFGALERRDKDYPAAALFRCATRDNQFQVRARRGQGRQFVRQAAWPVINDGGPRIGSAHNKFHTCPLVYGSLPTQVNISYGHRLGHAKTASVTSPTPAGRLGRPRAIDRSSGQSQRGSRPPLTQS